MNYPTPLQKIWMMLPGRRFIDRREWETACKGMDGLSGPYSVGRNGMLQFVGKDGSTCAMFNTATDTGEIFDTL